MCQGPTAVEALGGSICAALFRDIKPGALDSLDKPALLRTSKKLLAAGLKELENKEEKQRQRRNALHKHRRALVPRVRRPRVFLQALLPPLHVAADEEPEAGEQVDHVPAAAAASDG